MENYRNTKRRRKRNRSPEYLSTEMILRKSFVITMKEYFRNNSLAGARLMSDPNVGPYQRIIWLIVFCVAVGTICYFLQYIWSGMLAKPFVVTMESATYPISNIDFPAVAVCNINRISKKSLTRFAIDIHPDIADKESLKDVEKVLLNFGRLINYSYNESLKNNDLYLRLVEKYRLNDQQIVGIMKMLAPKCEDMILKCSFEGKVVNCQELFTTSSIANRGHCCTFNYWAMKKNPKTRRQKEPGSVFGLNVILDPLLDDYAYPLNSLQGFDILIFDSAHFADPNAGRVIHRFCEPNMEAYFELKSTKQIATEEVRKYSAETRECLFQNEYSEVYDKYSLSTCIVFCRIDAIYSLCKCTPYFAAIKALQRGPVCTLENLNCLNKYREKFTYLYPVNSEDMEGLEMEKENSLFCDQCLADCELTQYSTKSYEIPVKAADFKEKDFKNFFIGNINITNRSYLHIFYPLPSATLDRMDVVYYWFEVLSNIGGFCCVVVGFSFASVLELFYFLTVRLIRNFYVNYQKYH